MNVFANIIIVELDLNNFEFSENIIRRIWF